MRGRAGAVEVGAPAPEFALRDHRGQLVRLTSLRGAPVLLVFFPFAFTAVCSEELSVLRERSSEIVDAGAHLVGVSCDPMFTLRAFADQQALTYPLLSDFWPHGEVSQSFGVFDERRGCPRRSTFAIDGEGVVRWCVHSDRGTARDEAEYLRVLAGLPTM